MIERKIDFNINEDKTPVYDPDGKLFDILKEKLHDMNEKFSMMLYLLNKGALTEGSKQSSIVYFESKAVEILNELGYEGYLNKKDNEYTQRIRSLNEENRELRKQLGMKLSNEDARERFKLICDAIEQWWKNEGTDNVEEVIIERYCINVSLRGSVFRSKRNGNEKDQLDILQEKGFDITYSDWMGGYSLSATDKNFKMLEDVTKRFFPHSKLISIKTNCIKEKSSENNKYIIENIQMCILDLNDIKIDSQEKLSKV